MSRKFLGVVFLIGLTSLLLYKNPLADRSDGTSLVERTVLAAVDPFIRSAAWTRDRIRGVLNHYVFLVGTSYENERLKAEQAGLQLVLEELREKLRRFSRVERLLNDFAAVDDEPHVARVIAYDPFAQFQMVTVDQGSLAGITLRMVALGAGGVVGQVVRVGPSTSQVLLITDPNSAVDGVLASTRARIIIRGLGGHRLSGVRSPPLTHREFLEEGKEIVPGDLVMTSGLDGIFPRGLKVGKVLKEDWIVPAADVAKLEEVILVRPQEVR